MSWVVALQGACDAIQDGGHLVFYLKSVIITKQQKLNILNARHLKDDLVKPFAAFRSHFTLFQPKRVEKHSCSDAVSRIHSNLFPPNFAKMCLRDMCAAIENGGC